MAASGQGTKLDAELMQPSGDQLRVARWRPHNGDSTLRAVTSHQATPIGVAVHALWRPLAHACAPGL